MNGHIILVFIAFIFIALWNKKWAIFVGFALLVWMLSFRTNEVPDTIIYEWMYDDPLSRLDVNEIGYLYLGIAFRSLTGAEYIDFYITIVIVCLALWYIASKNILLENEHIGMLFLLFLSFYGFFYLGITTRNFLSEAIIMCGLCCYLKLEGKKKLILYLTCVVVAMFIHRSAAFFFLLIPLIRVKISTRAYYRMFVICIVLWLLSGSSLSRGLVGMLSGISMFAKLDNYSSSAEAAPSILSLQILINWIISYFAIKSRKSIDEKYITLYNYFLKINLMGLFTLAIIWSIPTSYRFYNMFFFFNYILIYMMIFHNNKIRRLRDQRVISIMISVVYFAILLHSFPVMLFY